MRDGAYNQSEKRDRRNIKDGIGMRSFQLVGCGIVLKLMAGCGI